MKSGTIEPPPRLRPNGRLTSPTTGSVYRVGSLRGEGGFGAAYDCQIDGSDTLLCLKITTNQASWHREAYMGELLHGHPRVIAVQDTFPIVKGNRLAAYAVVMELAEHGTVAEVIDKSGGWPEATATREIRALLTAVDRLHSYGAIHRDITPANVFVCGKGRRLKLGDFGISRHGSARGLPASVFAEWFAPPDIRSGETTRWTIGDDLWQVGQLLAMLLGGDVRPIATSEVKSLPCSDIVKAVIRRSTGEPKQRYPDASTMRAAFRPSNIRLGRIRSLDGRKIVFTGPMKLGRRDAGVLARRAGAVVLDDMSGKVDVVVVGNNSSHWIAGNQGLKLLEAAALRERGHKVTLIGESQFKRLVTATAKTKQRSPVGSTGWSVGSLVRGNRDDPVLGR